MSASLTEEEQNRVMLDTLENPSPSPSDILSDVDEPKELEYSVHRSSPMMIDDCSSSTTTTTTTKSTTITSTTSSRTATKRFLELYDCTTIRSSKGTSVIVVKEGNKSFTSGSP